MLMVSFIALAWYNCIELTIVMFSTFRRYQGLYFWSLLVSTWGIVLYSLSFVLKYYQLWDSIYVIVAGIVIGWYGSISQLSLAA